MFSILPFRELIGGAKLRTGGGLPLTGGEMLRLRIVFRGAIWFGRECQQRDVDAHGGWILSPVSSQWKLNFCEGGVFGDTQQTFIGFPAQHFLLIDDLYFLFSPFIYGS